MTTRPRSAGDGRRKRAAVNAQRRTRRRWWLGGAGAALIGAVVAVSLLGGTKSAAPTAVRVNGPAASTVGSVAPAFSVPTLSGAAFVAPTHRPTLLYFMAGWCGTCIPEAQALGRLERSVGDRTVLVAVDADPSDSWSSLRSFAQSVGSPGYIFAKDDGHIDGAFGVNSLDTTIVLDPSGRVAYRNLGALDDAGLRGALAKVGVRA